MESPSSVTQETPLEELLDGIEIPCDVGRRVAVGKVPQCGFPAAWTATTHHCTDGTQPVVICDDHTAHRIRTREIAEEHAARGIPAYCIHCQAKLTPPDIIDNVRKI